MFLGRKSELDVLEQKFKKSAFSFSVIYGRRRVGKTTLIKEFIKNKPAIYFQATVSNEKDNLENFSRSIGAFEGKGIDASYTFADFRSLFDNISQLANSEPLVLVIDEFPYLARSYPEISSILQYYMDHVWKENSGLHIILAGSSMHFMEHQVLGYESPLYGRKTSQIKVLPFTFKETLDFFPEIDGEDALTYYAITGGIPLYLAYMDAKKSVEENILNTFLNKNSGIFEEPYNLLQQELRNPASYSAILTAIAGGASKQNEIATKAGISTSLAAKQIDTLIELGIVEKMMPIGETSNKLGVYQVKDGLFRFWYRFIARNMSYIELDQTQELLNYITRFLNEFVSTVFEDISREWVNLQMKQGKFATIYGKLGSWWGTNNKTRQQEEIDVCGLDIFEDNILLGECKWKKDDLDLDVLRTLIQRGEDLFKKKEKEYLTFSKTGFTEGAKEFAEVQNILLVSFEEMVADFRRMCPNH
jgi:AAA+ ATPase superfamily predicted ATPase